MTEDEAVVGAGVFAWIALSGVPQDTEGVIDEDYGSGVMVAWDLPNNPLPSPWPDPTWRSPGYPLRDGFDKRGELHLLGVLVIPKKTRLALDAVRAVRRTAVQP